VGVGGEDAGRVRVVLADNQLAVENLRLDGGDPDPRAPRLHSGGGRLETDSAGREPDIRMVVLVGAVLMHESEMPGDRGAGKVQVIEPCHQSPPPSSSMSVHPFATDG